MTSFKTSRLPFYLVQQNRLVLVQVVLFALLVKPKGPTPDRNTHYIRADGSTPQPPSRAARQHAACVAFAACRKRCRRARLARARAGVGTGVLQEVRQGFEVTIEVYIEHFIYTTGAVTASRSSRVGRGAGGPPRRTRAWRNASRAPRTPAVGRGRVSLLADGAM